MNMPGFAVPIGLVFDPVPGNEPGTINFYTYYTTEWLFEGTQRALFFMLFGAGMLLFIGRLQKKTRWYHGRRILLQTSTLAAALGLFNAYILL